MKWRHSVASRWSMWKQKNKSCRWLSILSSSTCLVRFRCAANATLSVIALPLIWCEPFLLSQDEKRLFMLLEYINGGELFSWPLALLRFLSNMLLLLVLLLTLQLMLVNQLLSQYTCLEVQPIPAEISIDRGCLQTSGTWEGKVAYPMNMFASTPVKLGCPRLFFVVKPDQWNQVHFYHLILYGHQFMVE